MIADSLLVVVENIIVRVFYAGKNWRPDPVRIDTGLLRDSNVKVILAVLFLTGNINELGRKQKGREIGLVDTGVIVEIRGRDFYPGRKLIIICRSGEG